MIRNILRVNSNLANGDFESIITTEIVNQSCSVNLYAQFHNFMSSTFNKQKNKSIKYSDFLVLVSC